MTGLEEVDVDVDAEGGARFPTEAGFKDCAETDEATGSGCFGTARDGAGGGVGTTGGAGGCALSAASRVLFMMVHSADTDQDG